MMKKDLVIAVLATFCLSVTLFTILPTRSAEYDPWVDLDEDGRISIYDVVQMTSIYGMTGDPARNVNVTNWPQSNKPLFPEIIKLRAVRYNLAYNYNFSESAGNYWYDQGRSVLVDENMPAPPREQQNYYNSIGWGYPFVTTPTYYGESSRYTYDRVSQSDYYIQGYVFVSFPLETFLWTSAIDTVYFNVTVHLQKLDAYDLMLQELASATVKLEQTITTLNQGKDNTYPLSGFTFNFVSPVVFHSGEKLSVVFSTSARSKHGYMTGSLGVSNNNTFLPSWGAQLFEVQVPIAQSGP